MRGEILQEKNEWVPTSPEALAPPPFCSKNLNLGNQLVKLLQLRLRFPQVHQWRAGSYVSLPDRRIARGIQGSGEYRVSDTGGPAR